MIRVAVTEVHSLDQKTRSRSNKTRVVSRTWPGIGSLTVHGRERESKWGLRLKTGKSITTLKEAKESFVLGVKIALFYE